MTVAHRSRAPVGGYSVEDLMGRVESMRCNRWIEWEVGTLDKLGKLGKLAA